MNPADIPLFSLADRRLAWLDQRQAALSRNIANIDTPHFQPVDLPPFAQSLARAQFDLAPARTDPGHLPGTVASLSSAAPKAAAEQAPDGNAVSLDEQLVRVADTDAAQELVGDLYKKYLGMFRTAIGR